MINGASSIQNSSIKSVNTPYLSVKLYNGEYAGSPLGLTGIRSGVNNYTGMNTNQNSIVFNDNLIVFSNNNYTGVSRNYIHTYNSGGSLINKTTIFDDGNINLGRGDFQVNGSTLNLFYLAQLENDPVYENYIYRISSPNGISWGGTLLLLTESTDTAYTNYDIAVTGLSEAYLFGKLYRSDAAGNGIKYFPFGSSPIQALDIQDIQEEFLYNDAKLVACRFGDITTVVHEIDASVIIGNDTLLNASNQIYVSRFVRETCFDSQPLFVSGSTQDSFNLVKTSGSSGTLMFGIDRFNTIRETKNTSTYFKDIARMLLFTEMNKEGDYRQRYVNIGTSFTSCIALGGISSAEKPFAYAIGNRGNSTAIAVPLVSNGVSYIDITSDIISYSNSDNKRISLEVANY